jgi:hypothetical protein
MKTQRKAIVAGLAAILSLGVASGAAWAQNTQDDMKADGGAKVDNANPKMKTSGEAKMKGKAGSQTKAEGSGGADMKASGSGQMKAEGSGKMKGEGQNAEMKSSGKSDRKGQMKAEDSGSSMKKKNNETKAEMKSESKSDQNQMKAEEGSSKKHNGSKAEMKSETSTTNKAASDSDKAGTSNEKTGSVQKNGGVNVNVTTEQKTEIRQVIKTENVEPVEHVTFDVDVGTSIPHSVHLHRLPPRIVKIVPAYEAYEYFVLADGRIVIVDPDSYEIVYILA